MRHTCSVIGAWQYREMESSSVSASPAGEHLSCQESGGAGNQRFESAHGTGGEKGARNQFALPEGDGLEHGGIGKPTCRRERLTPSGEAESR